MNGQSRGQVDVESLLQGLRDGEGARGFLAQQVRGCLDLLPTLFRHGGALQQSEFSLLLLLDTALQDQAAVPPDALGEDELSGASRAGQKRAQRQALQRLVHVLVQSVHAENVTADGDLEEPGVLIHLLDVLVAFRNRDDAPGGQTQGHELLPVTGGADAHLAA